MTGDIRAEFRRAMDAGDLAALDRLKAEAAALQGHDWPDIRDAIFAAPIETVRWFLENGADPNQPADDGFPPLHCAIDRVKPDREAIIRLLIEHGADVNQRGANDWTPLHRAAVLDDTQAMRLLLDAGADRTIRTRIDDYATAEEEARLLGHWRSADFIRDRGR